MKGTTVKTQLMHALKEGVVNIRFRKRDGTLRDMRATLNDELIEVSSFSSSTGPDHIQCVWDVDARGWRSFYWDSLIDD